jgi:hypothetical protein
MKLTAYVIYGTLDGTTITLLEAKNKTAIALSKKMGEIRLLYFKAVSWDEACRVERSLDKTLDRVRRFTRK